MPHRLTDLYFGDVSDECRRTALGLQNDIFNVRRVSNESYASNDVLIRILFEHISAGVLVVLFNRLVDLMDGDPVFDEFVRQDLCLILLEVPAKRVYSNRHISY